MKKWVSCTIAVLVLFFGKINCNSTAVQLVRIPTTNGSISSPGTYYLGYDITGSLTIGADRVTLDLNGHTVRNIIIANRDNVRITNGIIDSSTAFTIQAGVFINGCTNIQLSNLKVLYTGSISTLIRGIYITGGNNVFLSHMLVEGFPSTGCKIEGTPSLLRITDCEFNKNGSALSAATDDDRTGLFIDHNNPANSLLVNIIVERCLATGNRTDGFRVSGRSLKASVWFFDCIARNNGVEAGLENAQSVGFHGKQLGFASTDQGNFVAKRCIAENNALHGFWAETNTQFYFERCISCNNAHDGFKARGDSIGHVKECTAFGNGECGFSNDGSGNNDQPVAYVANFAHTNQLHNYCLNGANRRIRFPYCVSAIGEDQALFWRNTDA